MNYISKFLALSKILIDYKQRNVLLPTMPIRLWIESSLVCNLSCIMCANKDIPGHEKGIMDFNLFKKIVDEAKFFVHDINIHHRGEPLFNENLAQMILYAKQAGLKVRFHTNATLLTKDKVEEIMAAKPDLISVSFDGFRKDVYEEVRRGASYENTLNNIKLLLTVKREKSYSFPYIIIERIDLKEYSAIVDQKSINKLTKVFKDWGADEVITKKEYNWVTSCSKKPQKKLSYNICTFPWYAMVICWDGTVTPCPQDYMAILNMGNIQEYSIKDIWNSKAYIKLREDLISNKPIAAVCAKCDRLYRKQFAGLPVQYMVTFLIDNFAGYGSFRRLIGSGERND
jgi:radical SAM protein with 4Fe4S-binding SPASM domain